MGVLVPGPESGDGLASVLLACRPALKRGGGPGLAEVSRAGLPGCHPVMGAARCLIRARSRTTAAVAATRAAVIATRVVCQPGMPPGRGHPYRAVLGGRGWPVRAAGPG